MGKEMGGFEKSLKDLTNFKLIRYSEVSFFLLQWSQGA